MASGESQLLVRERVVGMTRISVTSSSFSQNPVLRETLTKKFEVVRFNESGKRLGDPETIELLAESDGAIVGLESVGKDVIDHCHALKVISKFGVGLDNLDLSALAQRNICVRWTPGTNKRSVAEMVLGFMLCLKRNLYQASIEMKRGTWKKSGGQQLSNKTIGVIGLGNTGKEVVRLLKPFNCRVLGNDIEERSDFCRRHNVISASKEEIFRESDLITLHVPLNEATRHLICRETLAQMRQHAILINCSRGPVVDQPDLKEALLRKKIAGAALDVYEEEPPLDKDFLRLDNLFCTPHIGGNAQEAVEAMGFAAINHLEEYFRA